MGNFSTDSNGCLPITSFLSLKFVIGVATSSVWFLLRMIGTFVQSFVKISKCLRKSSLIQLYGWTVIHPKIHSSHQTVHLLINYFISILTSFSCYEQPFGEQSFYSSCNMLRENENIDQLCHRADIATDITHIDKN